MGTLEAKVKASFGLDSLRLVTYEEANLERVIERVAIYLWRQQSVLYPEAIAKGAQVYITGIYYHTAQEMLTEGLWRWILDTISRFFFTEKLKKTILGRQKEGWEIEILASQASTNPFNTFERMRDEKNGNGGAGIVGSTATLSVQIPRFGGDWHL